jgi:hypothetical protein
MTKKDEKKMLMNEIKAPSFIDEKNLEETLLDILERFVRASMSALDILHTEWANTDKDTCFIAFLSDNNLLMIFPNVPDVLYYVKLDEFGYKVSKSSHQLA